MAIDRKQLVDDLNKEATKRYQERAAVRGRESEAEAQDVEARGRDDMRMRLARANRAVVFERQIGKSDLLRVNYLARGAMVSRAVCHIEIRNASGAHLGDATGFLVSSRLLLTNAHVLLDAEEAANSLAVFDYEDDAYSLPKPRALFSLRGDQLFLRNPDLDVALVAVAPSDVRGEKSLNEFGFLRLRSESGKAKEGEHVSIIQHPNGRSKEIAVRANKIVDVDDPFIQYETDTDRGSSGSPVFSDEWEVVALHHASVKATDEEGRILDKDGNPWSPGDPEENIQWRANEGIRVSRIMSYLARQLQELRAQREQPDAGAELLERRIGLLEEVVRSGEDPASGPYIHMSGDISLERRNATWYASALGYDEAFLGQGAEVPLPDISQYQNETSETLLYRNFSLVMHLPRRQALFAVCNIDGDTLQSSSRHAGWKLDPRIEAQFQLDNDFYKDRPGNRNYIDRGHLVRRIDPAWGDLALEAIDDTFHYTNAGLQHRTFNNGIWGRLEDALIARVGGRTVMTVFTGPVFTPGDPMLRVRRDDGSTDQAQVPQEFWKVIAFADNEGWFTTAAFRQSQAALVQAANLDFETHADQLRAYQVPIEEIEQVTGLDFGDLRDYQATDDQFEAAREGRARKRVAIAADLAVRGPGRGHRLTRRHPEHPEFRPGDGPRRPGAKAERPDAAQSTPRTTGDRPEQQAPGKHASPPEEYEGS